MSARVSIIMPVFNAEPYLEKCMETVCNQTLKDVEIICINDGSTDSSLETLNRFADKDDRIKIISQENGGYGKAMNVGIRHATAPYVGIVEPDDYIDLEMFEVLYNEANNKNLDFIKSDFYACWMSGEVINNKSKYQIIENEELYNTILCPKDTPELISRSKSIANWTGLYRRSFIEKNQIYHHETPGASYQDTGWMWQVYTQAERAEFIEGAYYYYRADNPNSSSNNKGKAFAINKEYDFIKSKLKANKKPDLWALFCSAYQIRKLQAYYWTIGRISDDLKIIFIEQMRVEFAEAEANKEIDWNALLPEDRGILCDLLYDEKGFLERRVFPNKSKSIEKELEKIKKSKSYKIGKMVTYVPRNIKKVFR